MTKDEDRQRYYAAAHAMQSGVAMKMNYSPSETTPKHLRVGVNSAMVDTATIVQLLIDKGVFTEEEFYAALADRMEAEAETYRSEIQAHLGAQTKVTLA